MPAPEPEQVAAQVPDARERRPDVAIRRAIALFGHAFSIFLLRQYMLTIPLGMDDAARIDGAAWFQIYYRVIPSLSAPALGVVAIYNFTLPHGLTLLNGRYGGEIQQVMAQTALNIVPALHVFCLAPCNYVQGVAVSGVKG